MSLLCISLRGSLLQVLKNRPVAIRVFACMNSHLKLTETDILAIDTRKTLPFNDFVVSCLFSTICA